MIDIHSHLIFEVDDGASCFDESIRMIDAARKQNINSIIATPHFYNGVFSNGDVTEKYELLLEKAMDYGVEIRLGNELLGDDGIFSIVETIDVCDVEYMLLELPYSATFEYAESLIRHFSLLNRKLIIAHPERNRKVMRKLNEFIQLANTANFLIQIDAASILGIYGLHVKDIVHRMLKLEAVRYMASNAHCSEDYNNIFPAAVKKLYRLCKEEYVYNLLESNIPQIMTIEAGAACGRETG